MGGSNAHKGWDNCQPVPDMTVDNNNNSPLSLFATAYSCRPPSSRFPLHLTTIADTSVPRTSVFTASGQCITSTATVQLNLPQLPAGPTRTSHILPAFMNNLISIGQLCNAGCTAHFDAHTATIRNANGSAILSGTQEHLGPLLWHFHITPVPLATQATTDTPRPAPMTIPPNDGMAPMTKMPLHWTATCTPT